MAIIEYSDKCMIKQYGTSKEVEAEVLDFRKHKKIMVLLNKTVKLTMVWNGKNYEGRMAGIDFVSNGPAETKKSIGK